MKTQQVWFFAYKKKDYEDFIHSFIKKIDDILDGEFKRNYIYSITINFIKDIRLYKKS
jgi:hypothetical protein